MGNQAKINPQKHRGAQCLSPAELGAKDGARYLKRNPEEMSLASAAARNHLRHVKTGRLTPFDALAYCQAFLSAFVVLLALTGCSGSVEPAPMPTDCSVASEKVRLQLCPDWRDVITCSDVASTNPDLLHCVGYAAQQHTGNAWCCDWAADSEPK